MLARGTTAQLTFAGGTGPGRSGVSNLRRITALDYVLNGVRLNIQQPCHVSILIWLRLYKNIF
jgi:hypothetical protein